MEGFEGVHGGFGFGSRNSERELILEFAESLCLIIANTWFKKEDKLLVSYDSGGNRSLVDYVLVRAGERTMIKDVKVITNEPCISQHKRRDITQLSDEASVEDLWQDMKGCMLGVADEVCGKTKKPQRHKET